MTDKRKPLNLAEKCIVNQMRLWPTLYPDADTFLNQRVMGSSHYPWKKGLLVCDDMGQYAGKDRKGRPKFKPYPFRLPLETARDLMHSRNNVFRSVYRLGDAPIDRLPDDLHKDWQDVLRLKLFLDEKITPEMYAVTLEAYCIQTYHVRHNPHANLDHYQSNWEDYWKRIPHYRAELERIRKTQELGCVPPETFVGMGI
jgi:hypothetical protein